MFRLRGLQLTLVPDIASLWPVVGESKFLKFDFRGRLVILTFFGSISNLVYSLSQALSHHLSYRSTSIFSHRFAQVPTTNFVPRLLATLNNSKMSLSRSPIWTHCSGWASNRVDCRIFLDYLKLSFSSIGILVGLTFRFSALYPLNSFRVHKLTAAIPGGRPHVVMTKLECKRIPLSRR
jgi:hypothetical protein